MLLSEWNLADAQRIWKEEGIAIGEAKGIAVGEVRGIAVGEARMKIEFAKTLKSSGLDFDFISKTTGLSIKEIKKL